MKKLITKAVIGFLSTILMLTSSGIMEIAAQELNNMVNVANSYGDYRNQNTNVNNQNSYEPFTKNKEVLTKQNENEVEDNTFDPATEIEEERTEYTKTYETNGVYTKRISQSPLHTENDDGELVDIDNDLETNPRVRSFANPVYENKEGYYDATITGEEVSITKDGHSLSFLTEGNVSNFDVEDNSILYSELYENIDMKYILDSNRIINNLYINGPVSEESVSNTIVFGDLEVIEEEEGFVFLDDKENVVFTYQKPRLFVEEGTKPLTIQTTINEEDMTIKVILPTEWLASNEPIFPMFIQAQATAYEPLKVAVDTAYIRQNEPQTTSHYYDLFCGYEDGAQNGGINVGITRIYAHIGDLGIGPDKIVESAKLNLYKHTSRPEQWKEIEISKTNGFVDVANVNWSNKPTNLTHVSTTTIEHRPGWHSFDIKSYIEDRYAGLDSTLEIKNTNESSEYIANFFFSESGEKLPEVEVTYRDAWDVRLDLDINLMDNSMRTYSYKDSDLYGLSFDGIAKPDSKVYFDLVEKDKNEVILTEESKGNSDRYFIDPIFVTNPISNVQSYTKGETNYTTNYILADRIPEFDIPYEYIMRVEQGSNKSVSNIRTDAIVKYRVKNGDTLRSISSYYGVPVDQLKTDNNVSLDTIKEDQILLVRMKKDNPKVSKDVYEPPLTTVVYQAIYVDRGPRCYGVCEVLDPVSTTGNYYKEIEDFKLTDFEEISFYRYYNSTEPVISGMFGNGFTTELEAHISQDKEGNILFFKGDGKIYQIQVDGDTLTPKVTDRLEVTRVDNQIHIYHMDSKDTFVFDTYGSLVQIIKNTGHTIDITYDEYGMIPEIKLGDKIITFIYNENNLVKQIILPNGEKTSYSYDINRNLIGFTDASGNKEEYHFTDNRLTYITDKNGNDTAKNIYDEDGRVLSQEDGNENISEITYSDGKTVITNSDGSEEVYTFNEDYRTTSISLDGVVTSSYTYDSMGNIKSKTNSEGETTVYSYQGYDVTKIEYPDGTSEEYQYNENHDVIYHKDTQNIVTNYTFNGYDLTSVSDSKNSNSTYVYDSQHRVLSETNQFGVSKSYMYTGNQVRSITHSNGLVEYYEYNLNGSLIKESDNQGKNTTYIFNNNNQMIQKNYYDGSNEKWKYDNNGNVSSYQTRLDGIVEYSYDKNNNEIKVTQGDLVTTKTYDSRNRIISETNEQNLTTSYKFDGMGNKIEEIDHYGNVTKFTYDSESRLLTTTDSLGNVESNEYVGENLVKTTSKEGLVTTYKYDEFNRQIEVTNPNGTTETTSFDNLGNISSQTDGKSNVISFVYDSYGRVIETTIMYADGLTTTTKQSYDSYGNVVRKEVDGQVTTYQFDVYQREISSTDALSNTTKKVYNLEDQVIEEIDALNNSTKTKYNSNGDVIEAIDKNGNITKTSYNENGFKVAEEDALGFVTTYQFNNLGQTVKVIDPYLHETSYVYDEYNNVIEVRVDGVLTESTVYDNYGRQIESDTLSSHTTTEYDNLGRTIATKNELTGLTTTYFYDIFGNVVKEEDSEGLVKETEYDEYQRVVKTTDAYNRTEEKVYDVRDNVLVTKNYDGTISSSVFDVQGKVLSEESLGLVTNYSYDILGRQVKIEVGERVTEQVYDPNGQVIEVINNEITTKTNYDKNGNVVLVTDGLGFTKQTKYDSKNQVIETINENGNSTKQELDAYGNVVKTIDALGNVTSKEFSVLGQLVKEIDVRGFLEEYTYNELGLLIEFKDKNDNVVVMNYNKARQLESEEQPNGATTSYKYDVYGREVEITEPNGKVKTIEFDELGNVIKEEDGPRTTITKYDTVGNVTSITTNDIVMEKNSYNEYNQLVKQVDGNENVSSYQYDSYGQVIDSNEKGYHTETLYDVYGNVVKTIENDTYITETSYNEKQQPIQVAINGRVEKEVSYDPVGNSIETVTKGVKTTAEYDALSRMVTSYIPSPSDVTKMEVYQEVTYDEAGNALVVKDGVESSITRSYDAYGKVTSETDGNNNTSYYEFDSVYNLSKVEDSKERIVNYSYDESHNVTYKKVNDKVAEYSYDIDGNLITEESEYGYTHQYEFDVFGNKTSYTKPDGSTIDYTYDNLGNLLTEGDSSYTYDSRNNQLTATNEEGTVTYSYDLFNQMTSSTDTNGETVNYRYDTFKQVVEKEYVGEKVNYQYNDKGLVSKVTLNDKEVASYQYNHRNEATTIIQQQTVTHKTYDVIGRLLSQKSTNNNTSIYDVSYQYDNNNNIISETVDGKENQYAYNEYDELIESNKYSNDSLITTNYEYDVFGNQNVASNSEGTKQYSYNDKGQVTSITSPEGTIDYNYDDNGNIVGKSGSEGTETYTYNEDNQLTSVEQGQYLYNYEYDANKERISSTKTDLKDYHYDVWYDYSVDVPVVSEEDIGKAFERLEKQVERKEENNNTCSSILSDRYDVTYYKEPEVTEYVLDRNTEYTTVLAANDTISVYEDNTLLQTNDTIEVTGLNETIVASVEGSTVESYRYDDYGQSESTQGHGYNGEIKDETGLIYLRARYYDPDMGRFIQIDNNYGGEKEEVVTQNRYTYTLNNPYKYVDRDGNRVITGSTEDKSDYNPSTGANETPQNGYLPIRWLHDYNSLSAFTTKVKAQIPEEYRADALTYWFKRGNYSKNDNRRIKLKTPNSGGGNGSTKQDDEKITDNDNGTGENPNPNPPRKISIGITECSDTVSNDIKLAPKYQKIYSRLYNDFFNVEQVKTDIKFYSETNYRIKGYLSRAIDVLAEVRGAAISVRAVEGGVAFVPVSFRDIELDKEYTTEITRLSNDMHDNIRDCRNKWRFVHIYNPSGTPFAFLHMDSPAYKHFTSGIYKFVVAFCGTLDMLEPVINALLTVITARNQARMTWNEYQHELKGKGWTARERADLYEAYKAQWDGRMEEYKYGKKGK